jgi:CheY-like chemotaxis protein
MHSTGSASQRTVLHVDDDPAVLDVTRRAAARRDGLEVRTSTDPDAALADVGAVDCVVGDSVRTTDGEAFVVAARRTDPDVPVVLFTGTDWSDVAREAAGVGAAGYVRKGDPGALDALLDRVEAVTGDAGVPGPIELDADCGWTVVGRYDPDEDGELAVWLAGELAAHAPFDAVDAPPLFDVVDPEALRDLLESTRNVTVTFQYLDYQVGLNAAGDLAVRSV